MLRLARLVLALALLVALVPAWSSAQPPAGVVTNLEGSATAARTTLPQPVALKFRDDVFQSDRIVTGDRSIVRMLLSGKAVVAVRERSSLTITETPGESIEVKTPNAVAAVHGTVSSTEVIRATAQLGGTSGGVTTHFCGFAGQVALNFGGNRHTLTAGMFASGTGSGLPRFGTMDAQMHQHARAGLQTKGLHLGGGLGDQNKNQGGGSVIQPQILPGGSQNLGGGHDNNGGGGRGEILPGATITPDSLANPPVSPPFGSMIPNGLITDQYQAFGGLFGPGRVAIFCDCPNAWAGANTDGNVDLVSPAWARSRSRRSTSPAS